MFERAKDAGHLGGLPSCASISLTILQYADNNHIFGNGDIEQVCVIK